MVGFILLFLTVVVIVQYYQIKEMRQRLADFHRRLDNAQSNSRSASMASHRAEQKAESAQLQASIAKEMAGKMRTKLHSFHRDLLMSGVFLKDKGE